MSTNLLDPSSETRLSIAWYIGVPITVVIVLILAVVAIGGYLLRRELEAWIPISIGTVGIVIAAFIFSISWWPFSAAYHEWRPVRGEVLDVETRLIDKSGGGMSETFVVRYEGDPREFRCDDSRCALVKPGDVLEVTCKEKWQFTGTHGRECNFVQLESRP